MRGSSFRAAHGGPQTGGRVLRNGVLRRWRPAVRLAAVFSGTARICAVARGVGFTPSASDVVASTAGSCRAPSTAECAGSSSSVHALACLRGPHGADPCVAGIRVHATAASADPVSKLTPDKGRAQSSGSSAPAVHARCETVKDTVTQHEDYLRQHRSARTSSQPHSGPCTASLDAPEAGGLQRHSLAEDPNSSGFEAPGCGELADSDLLRVLARESRWHYLKR